MKHIKKTISAFLITTVLSTCASIPVDPGEYTWPVNDFWIIQGEETVFCKQVEKAVICL